MYAGLGAIMSSMYPYTDMESWTRIGSSDVYNRRTLSSRKATLTSLMRLVRPNLSNHSGITALVKTAVDMFTIASYAAS